MRKIILLCSAGMSTSMLVKKMQEAAKAESYDCEIAAYPMSEAKEKASRFSVFGFWRLAFPLSFGRRIH